MAKKSSSRKSLKSLFSRSEAKLDESVEKDADKNGGEKKRFKFLKFKIKSKGSSASEKSTSQQVSSSPELNKTAEDGDASAENIVSDKKRSSLYATAPRSKGKDFSYSELDLRKPKRFATFSLGFKKKKRRDDENTSKSTFGLHSTGIGEQEENPMDLSQVQLNQANTKTMFSMSQPELDTSNTFDIPSPPPVATNQLGSNFPLPNQSQSSGAINTEPESQEPLTNSFELLDQEIKKAPIATIPELQLDDPDSSEEEEDIPIHNSTKSNSNSSPPMTHTKTISAVDAQTAPSIPANRHVAMLDTSNHKTAVVDSVCVNESLHDSDVPQRSNTITEMSLTESTSVRLSHHQLKASDTDDSPTPSGEASLAYVDSTITESAPAFHTDNSVLIGDCATIHHEVSVSQNEISSPVCANENLPDSDVPQQSNTKTEITLTESTCVNHQPEASDIADSPTPSSEASLAYVDSTITESAPAFHTDNSALIGDCATIHHEVSVSQNEISIPVCANENLPDSDVPQQSNTKTEITLTESICVNHQPETSDIADRPTPSGEASLANVDSTITESAPAFHTDNSVLIGDCATIHHEVSVSQNEISSPVCANENLPDSDVPQQSNTKTEITLTESTCVNHQPEASDIADSPTPSSEASLAYVDSTITESAPAFHTDNSALIGDCATIHHEVSVSQNEISIPVCANENLPDSDVPQQSNTKTEITLTESICVNHQPETSDIADRPTPSGEASLAYVDSTITESAPAFHTDNSVLIGDCATIHHEVSVSQNEVSIPVCVIENLPDSDVPQQSNAKTEITLTESTCVNHQPVASDTDDSPTPSGEASLAYVDSTNTESAPAFHTDNSALIGDCASTHNHEESLSQNEISIPVCANENLPDNDVPRQSNTITEMSLTESTSVRLSHHQPKASDTDDSPTPSSEVSLAYVDSTITESAPAFHTDNSALIGDCATIHHEVSASQNEISIPVCTNENLPDTDVPQQSNTITEITLTESTCVNHQPEAFDIADSPTPSDEASLANVDSTITESAPAFHTDNSALIGDCASIHNHEVSVSQSERSISEPTRTITTTSAFSSEKHASPVNQDAVYGALYDSLFPETFASETLSSLSIPSSQINTEVTRHGNVEHVMIKTLNEWNTIQVNSHSDLNGQDTEKIPFSELTQFHAGVKSDNSSLVEDTVGSLSENFAPPISHCATSQGTDTQVTDSKQSAFLDKELVIDGTSADSGSPSPVPDKMTAVKGIDMKIEKTEKENVSAPSELLEDYEVAHNPAYLSVGSDDGSTIEVYYSAEEDNTEESGDGEMYTMDEIEETCVVDGLKEVEELQQQKEENKIGSEVKQEHLDSLSETQQLLRKDQLQETEFLEGSDERSQETEIADRLFPLIKRMGEEERKEKLLATPVQQVNTLMVCKFAPPSSKLDGQGEGSEGNWTVDLETQDHSNEEKQLPNVQVHASGYREESMFTPKCRDAEEQVSLTGEAGKKEEGSKEGTDTTTIAIIDASVVAEVVTGTLAHCIVPKSDATEIEHNRAVHSSEWVDPITQGTNRNGTVLDQMSVLNTDTHHPGTKSAEAFSRGKELPPEVQADLNQGSLIPASESQQTEVDQKTADKMNSGFSRLSTSLFIKNSSPTKEDDSTTRFRKLSLVTDADNTEVNQDVVDFRRTSTTLTESTEPDLGSEYKFRNNFGRVSQYKPYKSDNSSFSHRSYQLYDTSTSSFSSSSVPVPVAIAYKYHSNVFSSSSSHSPEEPITLDNRLSDVTVHLSRESEPAGEPKDECGRSFVEQEESAAPAGEREGQREGEAESERIKSRWESQQLPVSSFSSVHQTSRDTTDTAREEDGSSSHFTGVFKAMRVELVPDQVALPPASPDMDSPRQCEMDSLVDTLKSMGPSQRPRSIGLRGPPQGLQSALPPIVEDAPIPTNSNIHTSSTSLKSEMAAIGTHNKSLNGLYTLPVDLGLKRSTTRDTRSPLELMKQSQQDQQQPGTRNLNLPLRTPATNNIMMRKFSDSSPEDPKSPLLNGNGVLLSPNSGSRLDNSSIFANYRSPTKEQTLDNGMMHRSIFGTNSLPETVTNNNRMSIGWKEFEHGNVTDSAGSRFERFSFLLNSSSSSSGSMNGVEDPNARMSRPPSLGIGSPPSNSIINSPMDYHRPFTTTPDSPLSKFGQTQGMGMGMGVGTNTLTSPILQRSFSNEGTVGIQQTSLFNSMQGGSQHQSKEPEPDKNLLSKYRAFPDAYLTKEKEHGKLNPRPGKIYIFDRPGMCGKRTEVRSDVVDATSWELQDTISIRVIRGGWVLYEKPNFKGEKVALDEGDIELTCPFHLPEEQQQNGQKSEQNGQTSDEQTKPSRKFIIGSLRRAVRDYSVPDISLFPEENAEGKKVIFRDTSEDARIFGFPIKANSIIINAGLWLVFAQPFFQGVPRVLEVGGYTNPAAWGVEQPYVGSLHPLKIAEPRVENINEPKLVIYDKPYFTGKSRTITTNMKDFMTRTDRHQTAFMYNVGSLKVLGGIWVGYEKEGFRGHQYLLEEGEYHDWRVWGGCDAELRSIRLIRADLTEPLMVMFEQLEEEDEGAQEESTFEVTEAIADVEVFGYKTSTRSIHVLSGAWIAYSHVDFSGNQYILEKGFYNNCADWGSQDTRICSVQPILLAPGAPSSKSRNEIILYSEPDFQGECCIFDTNQDSVSDKLLAKSCRVVEGSWVLYESKQHAGNMYVLSEGDYPNLNSMGCPPGCTIRSVKAVPLMLSVPSISLFGLEGLEGKEITTDTEIYSMVEEGFNNHILSVRVNTGCWVVCEHSNYRGRQFLLEPIEITNWPKFSLLDTIGSIYPIRQKRHLFRIKNKESGHYMSVQGGVEEMKSGRVVVAPEVEPNSDFWFYHDGLIKNKLSQTMNLQVMGNIEPGAKLVVWTETRQPVQTWTAQTTGLISSLTFNGMVLDVKGGKTYDKDHVVIMPESDERPSQQWEIELL